MGTVEPQEARVWTALPPDVAKGVARSRCVVLSRADAAVLVRALDGDITMGTAVVFPSSENGDPRGFSAPRNGRRPIDIF